MLDPSQTLRSSLPAGNVKHMKKALKHYAGVAQRASKARHISPCLPMSPHVSPYLRLKMPATRPRPPRER